MSITTAKRSFWGRVGATAGVLALSTLAACSSYTLSGRVVPGDVGYATFLDANDPQFSGASGIGGVTVRVWTDPQKLNRKMVASGVSNPDGTFSLEIDEFGAGFLDYDISVEATRPGYAPVEDYFKLPGKGRRVLIMMTPGRDTRPVRSSPMDDYNRYR
ncbi:MAG: hypothetical protein KF684_01010 [Phycisphaeraceae bacterium]|nr:hypothetical protein [Phycisphaeraceae bacterium]